MKILITGGAGYIGSRLALRCLSHGPVTSLDNLHRGKVHVDGVRLVQGDIRDAAMLNDLSAGVDVIFHLAAESAVMAANADPEYCFSANVTGTFRVLQAARANGVKRLVFTSSREVYGESQTLPVSETAALLPRNIYGASKAAGEMCCGAFPDLEISVVRLSNVYGPGDHGRVTPLFVSHALNGSPLTLFGAQQIMDFVWIDAVVDALLTLGTGSYIPGPLNLGSGKGIAIADLAQRVVQAAGSASEVTIGPRRDVEVIRFVADIRAAEAALGWNAPEDPLFGLPEVIQAARVK